VGTKTWRDTFENLERAGGAEDGGIGEGVELTLKRGREDVQLITSSVSTEGRMYHCGKKADGSAHRKTRIKEGNRYGMLNW